MKIRIYQINEHKDLQGLMFSSLRRTFTITEKEEIDSSIYDLVYDGETEAKDLEDIYSTFNSYSDAKPEDYFGRSMSVSDVVEIVDSDHLKAGFYYCDRIGFEKVVFRSEYDREVKLDEIQGIYCEPGKYASIITVKNTLSELQKLVEGNIEAYCAFEDGACIICNDEGKINGMRPTRGIRNENGELQDVVFGPFFICDGKNYEFESLSKDDLEKYLAKFLLPELLIHMPDGYQMIPYRSERMRLKDA